MTKDDSNLQKPKRDNGVEDADDDHDRVEDAGNDPDPGEISDIGTGTPDVVDEQPTQISQNDLEHEESQVMVSREDSDSVDRTDSDSVDVDYVDEDVFYNLPSGVETIVPWMLKLDSESTASAVPDENDIFLKSFEKFNTVDGCPDHFFLKAKRSGGKVGSGDIAKKIPKELAKKIQNEWTILENDLPDIIFVRVCEDRMDLLKAAIIGPSGTPYQDGLFFFDICFPEEYPSTPPLVNYRSHGLYVNPNFYEDGTICLSLLGTTGGRGCELWTPDSTILQVLVSIQALVLNKDPYYNEPENKQHADTPEGDVDSLKISGIAYLNSCRMMLYLLRKPPLNFEEFVIAYFLKAGKGILKNLRRYMDDERISSLSDDAGTIRLCDSKLGFKPKLQKLYDDFLKELTVRGADCGEFLAPKANVGPAGAPSGPPPSGDGGGVEDDEGGGDK